MKPYMRGGVVSSAYSQDSNNALADELVEQVISAAQQHTGWSRGQVLNAMMSGLDAGELARLQRLYVRTPRLSGPRLGDAIGDFFASLDPTNPHAAVGGAIRSALITAGKAVGIDAQGALDSLKNKGNQHKASGGGGGWQSLNDQDFVRMAVAHNTHQPSYLPPGWTFEMTEAAFKDAGFGAEMDRRNLRATIDAITTQVNQSGGAALQFQTPFGPLIAPNPVAGLSTTAKIGLGAGLAVGVYALIKWLTRRRQPNPRRRKNCSKGSKSARR